MSALRQALDDLKDNPEQWEAYQQRGHCAVLAPPGSGKTKLLTTKAVWLANNLLGPSQGLACVTLTNAAANELRTRIRALGQPVGHAVSVGTVHSFVMSHIIRPFSAPAGHPEWAGYTLAPRQVARDAMIHAINLAFPAGADTRYVASTISRNRKMCLTDEEWQTAGPFMRDAAEAFERLLRQQNYIDFDGAVRVAVDLVEQHPFVQTVLNARFPYLMIDEYQDLAPGLHRIVSALSIDEGKSTLFAVGDPDQAIFGFTGTRPELLLELADRSDVHRVDLRINYRCGAVIAQAAQRILGTDVQPHTMRGGGAVTVQYEPNGLTAQADYIAERIRALCAEGAQLREIAVLAPQNDDCAAIVEVLRGHGIPASWNTGAYDSSPLTIVIEAFAAWAACGREDCGHHLGDLLDQWQHLGDWDAFRAATDGIVDLLLHTTTGSNAAVFVEAIATAIDASALSSTLRDDDAAAFTRMRAALADGGAMAGYTVEQLGRLRLRDGRVEVSSMTSSKGLEFDHVFIAAVEQGRLPYYSSGYQTVAWLEDRRKFYVSFTRARESVAVVYSGWYLAPFGVKRDGPSVFLFESGLLARPGRQTPPDC
ncbi:ATP-dependent helicase [Nakamurella lactea]|uniref:ATP-dependent helicase n=1 Tax=Nakamurella lactea TaxID=459515 RepID=UPI000412CC0B|nr:ATP-dependent helicase [Nakamurella lactea]